MNATFLKSVLRAIVGMIAAQRGLYPGQLVHLFVESGKETFFVGVIAFSDTATPGQFSLCSRLLNQVLPGSEESDQDVIGAPKLQDHCKTFRTRTLSTRATIGRRCCKAFLPAASMDGTLV